jgi:hypothetical protein
MCEIHVQDIREHEGEIRKCARDNVQEIRNHWETQCAGDQGT